jgi:hypothetical protein
MKHKNHLKLINKQPIQPLNSYWLAIQKNVFLHFKNQRL